MFFPVRCRLTVCKHGSVLSLIVLVIKNEILVVLYTNILFMLNPSNVGLYTILLKIHRIRPHNRPLYQLLLLQCTTSLNSPYPSQVIHVRVDDDPPADDAVEPVEGDLLVRQLNPKEWHSFLRTDEVLPPFPKWDGASQCRPSK